MKTNTRYLVFKCGCEYEESKALFTEHRDKYKNLRKRYFCHKHNESLDYVVFVCRSCGARIENNRAGNRITSLSCSPILYCPECIKALSKKRYAESKCKNIFYLDRICQSDIDKEVFNIEVEKKTQKKVDRQRGQKALRYDFDLYATKYAYSPKKESEYFAVRKYDCKHYENCRDLALKKDTNTVCPKNCTHYEYKPLDINDFVVVKNIMQPIERFETVDKEFKRLLKKLTILEKKKSGKSIGWKDRSKQWHKACESRKALIRVEKSSGGKHAANS